MKYKAVIFDFDYTLGDCTEGIAASVNHGLKKMGYEAGELEDIRKTIGLSLKRNLRLSHREPGPGGGTAVQYLF